jgi:hypothetical protein
LNRPRDDSNRPWLPDKPAHVGNKCRPPGRCPKCGRPAHVVPGPEGPRYLTLYFDVPGELRLGPHVCLPRGASYPARFTVS